MATVDKLKISIVVLNYNGYKDTIECLESLNQLEKDNHEVEIIVVDNHSTDNSPKILSKIKGIKFIENTQNLGYSGGNNVGIRKGLEDRADYILILNNDTTVDSRLLVNLLSSPRVNDIICPKIYFSKGFEFHKKRYKENELGKVIWYVGAKIDWQNIIGVHRGVDEVDKGQFSKREQIDLATGACFLAKREVFEKIGFFDEKYFLYLEDMDFCVRAKRANFKIVFEPSAIIWHKNAGSSGSGSDLQDYFITRNRLLFALKYAKLRTKIAVLRHVISQIANPTKRKAFFDFLVCNFGKGSFINK